jgi:diaminohydroxyphosphoribosylaminopyrimidine deaminase/5-amino-6-(5-phosphoribosylamino)uracil reductase
MTDFDSQQMARALELARAGEGYVEPNPMVGCVVCRDGAIVGEGAHQRFGGPHAEVNALSAAGEAARGGTLYVTLEPCCHHGKTPPCTKAVLDAGIERVVVAMADPFPQVDGDGIATLREAGVTVEVGLLDDEARQLNAPYLKRHRDGRPWVIAKWAMTLDGKIASRSGDSRWISSEASREVVHQLRGRVDAILVGSRTAAIDDPQLTARPAGPRKALRVVVDSTASLSPQSRLVQTSRETPVLVAVGPAAPDDRVSALTSAGCEVFLCDGSTHAARLEQLLDELGRRTMTNVLAEGGGGLLGGLLDGGHVDEAHVFISPLLLGGKEAVTAIAGQGAKLISDVAAMCRVDTCVIGGDIYVRGRLSVP